VAKPAPQVVKKEEPKKFDPDQIAALLDKDKDAPPQPPQDKPPEQTASLPPEQPTLGGTTASIDAKMTANELDALRARLAQCWSPPIGWTDPSEVRVVLMITLNPDGSVAAEPQVLQQPAGRYAQTAAESALRAVRRCAPYDLPVEKYESWKQVKVTFDPTEMGGA
jgi:colicin import membrane protein